MSMSTFLVALATAPEVQQVISTNIGNPTALKAYLKLGRATTDGVGNFLPLSDEDADLVVAAQGKPMSSPECNALADKLKEGLCSSWSVHLVTVDGRSFTLQETAEPGPISAAQIVISS